ncbi:MAG: sulfatase-like hydrolase/transferase [Planctomycetota bacterium]|nr:sulfatase-like hydrolase/transferase [Planctomycetota bacterium]
MDRCIVFRLTAILIAGSYVNSTAWDKPNIVIILADDLGWGATSYHSNFAETPNIDRFVKTGIELDRFYVAPMCSPTRAGLLTGRYPIRFGLARSVIPPQRNFGLPVSELTLPRALAKSGYQRLGIFGKWHLGHHQIQWHPLSRGFTHFEGHYNGAIDYFDLTREGEKDWHQGFQPSDKTGYATDLITAAATKFITDSAKEKSPYFCYIPFNAPHSPFQAKPSDVKRYAENGVPKPVETLKAMIWSMDQGVGKILRAIEQSGESSNTQVWFFSDNGGVKQFKPNNRPLRGSKLTTFEGGIRVVAGVRWPSKWKGKRKIENVMGYIDVMPTILASIGSDPGKSQRPQQPFDGVNLDPLFSGQKTRIGERDWFSYHGQRGEQDETISVKSNRWKLIVNGPSLQKHSIDSSHQVFLFDIAKDPHEKNNISDRHPKIVAQLAKKLIQHRQLQPKNAVPSYGVNKEGFTPWKNWNIKH